MADSEADSTLGAPDPSLGGPDVEAAVANAEKGSQAEGDHTSADPGQSGESRLEQMRDVDVSPDSDRA